MIRVVQMLQEVDIAVAWDNNRAAENRAGAEAESLKDAPPGARVSANGRILFNAAGTRLVMQGARQIGTLSRLGIVWGVDPLANEVAGSLVIGNHANLTPFRFNVIEQTLSGDISGVLRDFPRLRPIQQKWVAVSRSTENRTNCFVVKLDVLLQTRQDHQNTPALNPEPRSARRKSRKGHILST